jgi:transglutaminase-like putative cysteine protease
MLINLVHETTFQYDHDVMEGVMEVRLTPVTDGVQLVRQHHLEVTPRVKPIVYRDYFGTTVHFFTIPGRYHHLAVTSRAIVETGRVTSGMHAFTPPETLRSLYDYRQFGGPVQRHAVVEQLAVQLATQPALDQQLLALNGIVHDRLEYQPLVTRVDSTLTDVLALGKGVCQDFAHFMIAVCRQLATPARYVSGYVYTNQGDLTRGAGASHAWCECYQPGKGWVGYDPTNNCLVDHLYVKLATGRDYRDVPPTKGTFRGAATESIEVTVHTTAV